MPTSYLGPSTWSLAPGPATGGRDYSINPQQHSLDPKGLGTQRGFLEMLQGSLERAPHPPLLVWGRVWAVPGHPLTLP